MKAISSHGITTIVLFFFAFAGRAIADMEFIAGTNNVVLWGPNLTQDDLLFYNGMDPDHSITVDEADHFKMR
jgi:hypothetical protein